MQETTINSSMQVCSASPQANLFTYMAADRHHARHVLESAFSAVAICGDILVVMGGFVLAHWLRLVSGWIPAASGIGNASLLSYSKLILLGWGIVFMGMLRNNLFKYEYLISPRNMLGKFFEVLGISMFVFLGLSLVIKTDPPISRVFVLCSAFLIFILFYAWRLLLSSIIRLDRFLDRLQLRLLVVGWSPQVTRIRSSTLQKSHSAYKYIGWLESGETGGDASVNERLGTLPDLSSVLSKHQVDVVLMADPTMSAQQITNVAMICEQENVDFKMVPRFFEFLVSGLHATNIANVPVLGVDALPLQFQFNRLIKRCVDCVGALVGLTLAAPIIALFGALVYIESPGPIFYRQIRTGRGGRSFAMFKIRSMRLNAEEKGGAQWAKEGDPRRLRIGAFMRKWNVDEVPQFWNVLKGDMSLVGPRPERPELINRFKHEILHYNARHVVSPGITGWAQVNGWRGNTDLVERIQHDIWYVENWSLWLDFKIMLLTFVKQENAY